MSNEAVPQRRNRSNADSNPNVQARFWCFTLNNPTDDERTAFAAFESAGLPRHFKFLIFQEERAPSTGTIHFQGYLELDNSYKKSYLINNFNGRAAYQKRRGTQEEAIAYCCKEDTRVEGGMAGRYGEPCGNRVPGEAKEKAIKALDQLRKGEIRYRDIDSETLLYPGFNNAARGILCDMLGPKRDVEVFTIIGGSGIGKSYACYEYCGRNLVSYSGDGWFGGASTEGDNLLFDEFTGGIRFDNFLKLLDGYAMQLPVKGSMYPAHYTKVFITSNVMPELWWTGKKDEKEEMELKREGHREMLYRRIGYTGPNGEYPQFENGHFIHIPETLPVQTARKMLRQRLYMLGVEVPGGEPDPQPVPEEPAQEEHPVEEPPRLFPRPIDQLDDLFSNSLNPSPAQ